MWAMAWRDSFWLRPGAQEGRYPPASRPQRLGHSCSDAFSKLEVGIWGGGSPVEEALPRLDLWEVQGYDASGPSSQVHI